MKNTFEFEHAKTDEFRGVEPISNNKEVFIDPKVLEGNPEKTNDSVEMERGELNNPREGGDNVMQAEQNPTVEAINTEILEADRTKRLGEVREQLNNSPIMQSETITANGIERGGSDGVTINNVIVNNAENGGNSGGSGYEMSASNEYEDCSVCGGTGRVPLFFSFLRIWPCSTCGATGRVVKSESFSHKSSE
jgi:hypothetical protein